MFEKLREKDQHFSENIRVLEGDVTQTDLGLKQSDRQLLLEEVTVVFHLAQVSKCESNLRYDILHAVNLGVGCIPQPMNFISIITGNL